MKHLIISVIVSAFIATEANAKWSFDKLFVYGKEEYMFCAQGKTAEICFRNPDYGNAYLYVWGPRNSQCINKNVKDIVVEYGEEKINPKITNQITGKVHSESLGWQYSFSNVDNDLTTMTIGDSKLLHAMVAKKHEGTLTIKIKDFCNQVFNRDIYILGKPFDIIAFGEF